ncbi:hypothetical protein K449DRAFT_273909 [Hypoxylon sp. EC38]|nr:hypothetical protein K449DRAFT_273909 [Hypoxylon sp. EC38]
MCFTIIYYIIFGHRAWTGLGIALHWLGKFIHSFSSCNLDRLGLWYLPKAMKKLRGPASLASFKCFFFSSKALQYELARIYEKISQTHILP